MILFTKPIRRRRWKIMDVFVTLGEVEDVLRDNINVSPPTEAEILKRLKGNISHKALSEPKTLARRQLEMIEGLDDYLIALIDLIEGLEKEKQRIKERPEHLTEVAKRALKDDIPGALDLMLRRLYLDGIIENNLELPADTKNYFERTLPDQLISSLNDALEKAGNDSQQ